MLIVKEKEMEEDKKQLYNQIIQTSLDIYSNDDSDITMIEALSLAIEDEKNFDFEEFSFYIRKCQRDFYGALYVDCSNTKELKNYRNNKNSDDLDELF